MSDTVETPGTWKVAGGSHVPFDEAKSAWALAACLVRECICSEIVEDPCGAGFRGGFANPGDDQISELRVVHLVESESVVDGAERGVKRTQNTDGQQVDAEASLAKCACDNCADGASERNRYRISNLPCDCCFRSHPLMILGETLNSSRLVMGDRSIFRRMEIPALLWFEELGSYRH